MEGAEDDIRATYYILAFQREFNDDDNEAELRWKVVDMMVVGGDRRFVFCLPSLSTFAFCVLTIYSEYYDS